jgi:hypothetical protein
MRLTVVGCSGSIPSERSPASCYLLEAEGFRLVVDLGSGGLGLACGSARAASRRWCDTRQAQNGPGLCGSDPG